MISAKVRIGGVHIKAWINADTGYDMANQTVYLDDMIRWTMDWLMKVSRIRSLPHTGS